jgi:O-antigen/teichoic acid export membrane protein
MELSATAPLPISPVARLGKRILAAGTIYGLTNFGIKGINFLILPVVSRFLRPADFGIVSLADTIAGPIGMICGLGAATSLRRMYYDYVDDPARTRAYLGTTLRFVMLSTLAITVFSCVAGPRLIRAVDKEFAVPFFPFLMVAICTAGLGQVEQTQLSIFQVQNRPSSFALMSVVTFVLGFLSVGWLVVWFHLGGFGVLASRLIAVSCAVLMTAYVSRWCLSAPWDWSSLGGHLRLGFPVALFEVANLGLVFADRLILQHYRPLEEVGIYALAYTFGSLMLTLTVSLSQAWSPLFFESACYGNTAALRTASSALMAGLVAIATLGVIIARPAINILLDRRYAAAAPLVPIILGAYLVNSFYYLFELQAIQHKRTSIMVAVTISACAINIALNIWWVPRWGIWGAAFATIAAYVFQAGLMYATLWPQVEILYSKITILAYLAIFAGALVVAEMPCPPTGRPFVSLLALIGAFALLWRLGLKRLLDILNTSLS